MILFLFDLIFYLHIYINSDTVSLKKLYESVDTYYFMSRHPQIECIAPQIQRAYENIK